MTFSLSENDDADPDTYAQVTSKNPVSSRIEEIVNKAKSEEFALFDIRKWPFIVDVESSIVLKNDWTSVELTSKSSRINKVADGTEALLNFSTPVPGSVWAVSSSNMYSRVMPPKFP
jgi:hypothetical protein